MTWTAAPGSCRECSRTPVLRLAAATALAASVAAPLAAAPVGSPVPPAAEGARAFDRGDYPQAIALAGQRLRAAPEDVAAHIVKARAEAALGRFEAAYQGFRKVLALQPRNTDALYYLTILGGVLAQAEYDRLLSFAPDSARAHQLLGDLRQAQDRPAEAEAEYKSALEAAPASLDLLVTLGDLVRHQSRFEDALAYYARAARIAPRNYDVLYGTGVCHSYRQEYARAIESFREALSLEPSSASARLALGHALLQSGQPAAAVPELQAAASLEPRMVQAHYLLGRAYTALGRSREAAAVFEKVKTLSEAQAGQAASSLESSDPLGQTKRPEPRPSPERP